MLHNQANKRIFLVVLAELFTAVGIVTANAANLTDGAPAEICSRDAAMDMILASDNALRAHVDPPEVKLLAKLLWGEARGLESVTEQSAVAWCVLNRVDSDDPYYPDTVIGVVEQEGQFHGYDAESPVTDELYALAEDVLIRWRAEKDGAADVGRTLPAEYLWFHGDGETNTFTDDFRGGNVWDWSLPSPYED